LIATINIIHDDDIQTLNLLKKSIEFDRQNKLANKFHNDLQKLGIIGNEYSYQTYFEKILVADKKLLGYEKKYLAKAAYELAKINWGQNKIDRAIHYLNLSLRLNPWRMDPYIYLADIYLYQEKTPQAEKILQSCVNLIKDAIACKNKLSGVKG
jgi:tetratricopeptide (TPR) repeat protein